MKDLSQRGLMVTTGLRPSECLGLKWSDIDLKTGDITVQRSLALIRGQGWKLQEPKSKRSRRTVRAPMQTIETLRRLKADQAEHRMKAGPNWIDHGFVFTNEIGEPQNWTTARTNHWYKIVGESGVKIRAYDLRHVCASQWLKNGIDIRTVSELLGHSDAGFTLETYTHMIPGSREAAAEVIGRVVFGD
jgi:integrase